jgi:hypothetical protein
MPSMARPTLPVAPTTATLKPIKLSENPDPAAYPPRASF